MTTIILHGYLKDLHPEPIRVQANSAAEAISALALVPELQPTPGQRHLVRVEGFNSSDALYDKRDVEEIHIHPVVSGAGGGGGLGQILIGIAMVVVAIYFPMILPSMISPGSVLLAGSMMILGGILQAIAPQPSLGSADSEERSRYLGNGRNTTAIGTRIPMIYGRRKQYGQYLSFDVDAGVFDGAPAEWYSSTFTDYGELNHSAAPVDLPLDDPATVYVQPTTTFIGLSYPPQMNTQGQVTINFQPVELTAGTWDINFATGQTLHVLIAQDGPVSSATILGGKTNNLPLAGTSIVFTQNHI